MSAEPVFATKRNPARETIGGEIAKVAEALGFDPMPWQRLVWDVTGELNEAGNLWYRLAKFATPRQAGKTSASLPVFIDRLKHSVARGWGSRPQMLYSAQSGDAARAVLLETWVPTILDSVFVDELGKVVRSNGREGFGWEAGGALGILRNSLSAGHGRVLDMVCHDECFALPDARLEQATRPAMITRPSPQTWMQSTAGDAISEWWFAHVVDGRECVDDPESRTAYFEWALPEGVDLYDVSRYAEWHPAIGHTITAEALATEIRTMKFDEALRAYGNRWTKSKASLIPDAAWLACLDPEAKPAGTLHLALDVCPGGDAGRSTAIVVCGSNRVIEVVDHRAGTGWVIERLKELDRRHSFATISVDSVGPVRGLRGEIGNAVGSGRLKELGTSDACAAAQRLHSAIIDGGEVKHRGQESLTEAAQGSAKRAVGDSWLFGRKTSHADVSPLIAAALAHYQAVAYGDGDLRIH